MILNLTSFPATPEQIAGGVVDVKPEMQERLCRLLWISPRDLVGASPHVKIDFLRVRAMEIISEFVFPESANASRQALKDSCERSHKDVEVLNFVRSMGKIRCMIEGDVPLMLMLVQELKKLGHKPLFSLQDEESGKHMDFIEL